MALWVSPCSTRQRKENSQQFSIPTHTHPAPCESLVPFALRQATIAVANCATLFFLARKILNYIRLQSARVSGKNHWKTAEQSNTWISVQSRCPDSDADIETDMNNNPPNFPFLPHLVPHPPPPAYPQPHSRYSWQKQQLLVTSCPQFFHIFFWHIFRTYCPHFEWLLSSVKEEEKNEEEEEEYSEWSELNQPPILNNLPRVHPVLGTVWSAQWGLLHFSHDLLHTYTHLYD